MLSSIELPEYKDRLGATRDNIIAWVYVSLTVLLWYDTTYHPVTTWPYVLLADANAISVVPC